MLMFSLLLLAAVALAVPALTHACAAGLIKVNPLVGIRTAKTMKNAETWRAGHAAALRPLWVSGVCAAAVTLVGLLFPEEADMQIIMALLATLVLLVATVRSAKLANHAADNVLAAQPAP